MPFDLLRHAAGQPRFAWLHQGTAWIGLGLRRRLTVHGPHPFAQLRQAIEHLTPQGDLPGPWFVGFRFAPNAAQPDLWGDAFPDGALFIPQTLHGPLDLTGPSAPQGEVPTLEASPLPLPDRAGWREAVRAALAAIARGELRKVVLARAEALHFAAPPDPVAVLQALAARHPNAFCFLFEPTPGVAFVGATPERLARVAADGPQGALCVQTMALAGTAPRGATPAEDLALGAALLASDKDRREHALVVAAIREALTPLTTRLDVPTEPRLRRLPGLQHLETPITGTLHPGMGLLEVAAALHPTPALGGTPREAALRFIAAHEPFPRGWYAAPVGLLFPNGTGELAVAIRSALLLPDRAVLFAGAGIVAGSDPDREWEETALKMRTMQQALAEAVNLQQSAISG